MLGIAEKLLGYDRILVRCFDGFTRLCRIRGKMKRRTWIRINDMVLVSPWDFQSDKQGDITYRLQEKPSCVVEEQRLLKEHGQFLKPRVPRGI